ncbi:hypothetical protein FN846DRAFT_1001296 [Sphaerosporella brunnea]|uniref:Uncharacterized protein n=1 Tax=Sphaerosporella brunnea TaxID=1250544 RepID=A0A5J5EFQ6_9PEZI|nr:hypothetical protein FN846DRAFT_1001296 [Sphaerosporella brunnea]
MGNHKYGVVLDAGSAGPESTSTAGTTPLTREIRLRFRVTQHSRDQDEKEVDQEGEARSVVVLPSFDRYRCNASGLETFHDKPTQWVNDHLAPLLFARCTAHTSRRRTGRARTLFLSGDSGNALVKENERKRLLGMITRGDGRSLRWIAANYLLGGFDDPKAHETHEHAKQEGHHTYAPDMGVASAQSAFARPECDGVGKTCGERLEAAAAAKALGMAEYGL